MIRDDNAITFIILVYVHKLVKRMVTAVYNKMLEPSTTKE